MDACHKRVGGDDSWVAAVGNHGEAGGPAAPAKSEERAGRYSATGRTEPYWGRKGGGAGWLEGVSDGNSGARVLTEHTGCAPRFG